MNIAMISRATLFKTPGGDTIQIQNTANALQELGIRVTVFTTDQNIAYNEYDLLHFFNITRPADILYHIQKTKKPFVITPVLIDYTEFDQQYRKGFSGLLLKLFSFIHPEYLKTIARWLRGKDTLRSLSYLWRGHNASVKFILQKAKAILPNAAAEAVKIEKEFATGKKYFVVPNGIDTKIFNSVGTHTKENGLVICAARIEGLKNQINLIKAINETTFKLLLIGEAAPNQQSYFETCKKIAGSNVEFIKKVSQQELVSYFAKAKVHVLPSWFETCGLSSLEAAAMNCNIVITDKGFTKDYFGENAFYCEPGDPSSIKTAIENAMHAAINFSFAEKIKKEYTWQQAAEKTKQAYEFVLQ